MRAQRRAAARARLVARGVVVTQISHAFAILAPPNMTPALVSSAARVASVAALRTGNDGMGGNIELLIDGVEAAVRESVRQRAHDDERRALKEAFKEARSASEQREAEEAEEAEPVEFESSEDVDGDGDDHDGASPPVTPPVTSLTPPGGADDDSTSVPPGCAAANGAAAFLASDSSQGSSQGSRTQRTQRVGSVNDSTADDSESSAAESDDEEDHGKPRVPGSARANSSSSSTSNGRDGDVDVGSALDAATSALHSVALFISHSRSTSSCLRAESGEEVDAKTADAKTAAATEILVARKLRPRRVRRRLVALQHALAAAGLLIPENIPEPATIGGGDGYSGIAQAPDGGARTRQRLRQTRNHRGVGIAGSNNARGGAVETGDATRQSSRHRQRIAVRRDPPAHPTAHATAHTTPLHCQAFDRLNLENAAVALLDHLGASSSSSSSSSSLSSSKDSAGNARRTRAADKDSSDDRATSSATSSETVCEVEVSGDEAQETRPDESHDDHDDAGDDHDDADDAADSDWAVRRERARVRLGRFVHACNLWLDAAIEYGHHFHDRDSVSVITRPNTRPNTRPKTSPGEQDHSDSLAMAQSVDQRTKREASIRSHPKAGALCRVLRPLGVVWRALAATDRALFTCCDDQNELGAKGARQLHDHSGGVVGSGSGIGEGGASRSQTQPPGAAGAAERAVPATDQSLASLAPPPARTGVGVAVRFASVSMLGAVLCGEGYDNCQRRRSDSASDRRDQEQARERAPEKAQNEGSATDSSWAGRASRPLTMKMAWCRSELDLIACVDFYTALTRTVPPLIPFGRLEASLVELLATTSRCAKPADGTLGAYEDHSEDPAMRFARYTARRVRDFCSALVLEYHAWNCEYALDDEQAGSPVRETRHPRHPERGRGRTHQHELGSNHLLSHLQVAAYRPMHLASVSAMLGMLTLDADEICRDADMLLEGSAARLR